MTPPKLRVQTRTQIAALQRRLGVTTVYVTHDQIEAMTMADRIVVMRDGVVEQSGGPLDLYDRRFRNLSSPLVAALPDFHVDVQNAASMLFRLGLQGGVDLRREVFRLAVEKGWTLLELHQTTPSLEDVFLRLTTRDTTAPAGPEEEGIDA